MSEIRFRGIVARAMTKSISDGGKCSRYLCNLKKKHDTEKNIPTLISQEK
jgi:hypothetical protein